MRLSRLNFRRPKTHRLSPSRRFRLRAEKLEQRLVLSGVSFGNDRMFIDGTGGDDVIAVRYLASQQVLSVTVNGVSETIPIGWGTTPGFSTIVIRGWDGNDSINLQSDPDPAKNILIEGGAGNDVINIDPNVGRFSTLRAPSLHINGGAGHIDAIQGDSGNNTLNIFDDRSSGDIGDYVIGTHSFEKSNATTRVTYSSFRDVNLHTNDADTMIRVEPVLTDRTVTVIDHGGADQVHIRDSNQANRLTNDLIYPGGTFRYRPGSGPINDTVVFYDQSAWESADYTVGFDSVSSMSRLHRDGSAGWEFGPGVADYILYGSNLGSTYSVDATAPGSTWNFYAGAGDDTLRVAPLGGFSPNFGFLTGGYLSAIQGNVVFRGGAGNDQVQISDSKESMARHFHLHADRVEAQPKVQTGFDPFPTIWHFNVEGIEVSAGTGHDAFTVHSMATTAPLRLFGNDGDDAFTIGSGDLLSTLRANLQIDGGAGSNSIRLRDQLATVEGGYFFDTFTDSGGVERATFRKLTIHPGPIVPFIYQTGLLTARGLAGWWFEGSPLDDTFHVIATLPETNVRLDGNNGIDTFRVNAPRHRASLDIRGGQPTTAPGDSLYILGNGNDEASYTPGINSNSGRVTVNGTLIRFGGLEPIYVEQFRNMEFISPRSKDNIFVAPESHAGQTWMKIHGTSGVQNVAFESLSVRTTEKVTINVFSNDLVVDPFWDPNPDPTDNLYILPGALEGHGVAELDLVVGNQDTIHDATLYGPSANTILTVIAATSGVLHRIEGPGVATEVSTEPGIARTRLKSEAGETKHALVHLGAPVDVHFVQSPSRFVYLGSGSQVYLEPSAFSAYRLRDNQAAARWHFHGVLPELEVNGSVTVNVNLPLPSLTITGVGLENQVEFNFAYEGAPNTPPVINLEGTFAGVTVNGAQLAGEFSATTFGIDASSAMAADGRTFVELLVHVGQTTLSIANIRIPSVPGITAPTTVTLQGNPGVGNTAWFKAPTGPDHGWEAIIGVMRGINELSVEDPRETVAQRNPGDGVNVSGKGYSVTTDNQTAITNFQTDDVSIIYWPDWLRPVNFNIQSSNDGGAVTMRPEEGAAPTTLEHTFGPNGGEIHVRNLSVGTSSNTQELTLVGSDLRSRFEGGSLGRDFFLKHELTGSTSVLDIRDSQFESFSFEVVGLPGTHNQSNVLIANSHFEGDVSLTTHGAGETTVTHGFTGNTFQGGLHNTFVAPEGSQLRVLQAAAHNEGDMHTIVNTDGGAETTLVHVREDRGRTLEILAQEAFTHVIAIIAQQFAETRALTNWNTQSHQEVLRSHLQTINFIGDEYKDTYAGFFDSTDAGTSVVDQAGVFVLVAEGNISFTDLAPPRVTSVKVRSSTWSTGFLNHLDPQGVGFEVDGRSLPWANLDQIIVQFSEPVVGFDADQVALLGVNLTDYGIHTSYDSINMRGIITLQTPAPLKADKLRLVVNDAVTDNAGNPLDGDGDSTPGGVFNKRLDVLVGDASGDGSTNGADLPWFASAFNQSIGSPRYEPRADWNGDGSVNGADLTHFAGNFNISLPSSDPAWPSFPAASLSIQDDTEERDKYFSQLGGSMLLADDTTEPLWK